MTERGNTKAPLISIHGSGNYMTTRKWSSWPLRRPKKQRILSWGWKAKNLPGHLFERVAGSLVFSLIFLSHPCS